MPIPFILAGLAVAAGGYGVKKGVDGAIDTKKASEANKRAQEIYDDAEYDLNRARKKTFSKIEDLGKLKISIYEGELTKFIETFKHLKNTDELEYELNLGKPKNERFTFDAFKTDVFEITHLLGSTIASAGAGAAAGFGALGGAGMFAAASTGTAISSLSGVAATNATLAWFGGGSIASGGLGMAGGTMVLGGIVAGPVLAVAGSLFAAKAEEAKNNAYANLEKAKAVREEMRAAQAVSEGIYKRCDEMQTISNFLNEQMRSYNQALIALTGIGGNSFAGIITKNTDYQKFTKDQQIFVRSCVELAKTLKNVCDAPIIDEKGKITAKSQEVLNMAQELRGKLENA